MNNKNKEVPKIVKITEKKGPKLRYSQYEYLIRSARIKGVDMRFGLCGGYEKLLETKEKTGEIKPGFGLLDSKDELILNLIYVFSDAKPKEYYQYIQQILDPTIKPVDDPGIWGGFGGEMYNDHDTGGFYWTAIDGVYEGELTHPDGINLFYNYFKAFEIYVDEYLDESYQQKEWYKLFKQELPNLEKVYKDLISKGDIVEVEQG